MTDRAPFGVRVNPAANSFNVPHALIILILDEFRIAGKFLLCGG